MKNVFDRVNKMFQYLSEFQSDENDKKFVLCKMKKILGSFVRPISTVINEQIASDVKPFSAMPGPKGIFGIGNFYNYMKIFGEFCLLLI